MPGGEAALSRAGTIPTKLRKHWQDYAFKIVSCSDAKILLVVGGIAARAYMIYIKEENIPHQTLWTFGKRRFEQEIPLAWLQFEAGRVQRLVFAIPHPEAFNRHRARNPTDTMRKYCMHERTIDYCLAKLFGKIHLPCFLLTTAYAYQLSTGSILEIWAFRNSDAKKNDTLSTHFKRPRLDI